MFTKEYYLTIQRFEVLIHATCLNCENTMLSEKNSRQSHMLYAFVYIKCPK